SMASARPDVLFLVFGGNDSQVKTFQNNNRQANLKFMGYKQYTLSKRLMLLVDFLLMPYQDKVSIGIPGHDTAQWMSPMKMFEYMASGVPVISSDLPVLREILKHGKNSYLVPPDDPDKWIAALDYLLSNRAVADSLGKCAHSDYRENHTWKQRANYIMNLAGFPA
ncbi:MAG: glycosyltransferase, partial [Mariniphaga sp.]|nr:glycosyltransferase [Mariniphaga sp.]